MHSRDCDRGCLCRGVVPQHMHCFICFDVMRKCRVGILSSLTPEHYKEARNTIISLILCTDLQQHFEVRVTHTRA